MNKGRPTLTGSGIECKQCKSLVARWPQGKNTQKRTLFVCDKGKHWSGMVCPTCHNYNRANAYKPVVVRSGRAPEPYIAPGTKLRPCRGCSNKTPNYFYCTTCYNVMKSQNSVALAEVEFLHG